MRLIALIAVAGALGAVARWGLGGLVQRWAGADFPWGTLLINLLGCFALGFLMHVSLNSTMSAETRQMIGTGILGAFTTFSTNGYETLRLLQEGAWRLAAGNIAGNVVAGILLAWLGMVTARLILGGA
jgi:CrcB protein